jgi:hypothetical protein
MPEYDSDLRRAPANAKRSAARQAVRPPVSR